MPRLILLGLLVSTSLIRAEVYAQRQMENLNRGVVAIQLSNSAVYVGWRLLGTDPEEIAFNVYSQHKNESPQKLNKEPITNSTNLVVDLEIADDSQLFFIRPVIQEAELHKTEPVTVWRQNYLEIPLNLLPDYKPGDASVADLNGDGELEIVLHQVSRARDNGSAGITSEPILDAYKLDGTHLWRINLGKNIREGEHYTQFMAYDLDGDGCAEIACKTADGTIDGLGNVIGVAEKDWRTISEGSRRHGRILDGPEYLTIFDGKTGAALESVDYVPNRYPIRGWGGIGGNAGNDSYGNRCDRFLACVAYLDGERPSLVMCRGVYGRTVIAAWDWRAGKLNQRWVFDSGISYPPYDDASPFSGMGGHSISVADVDADGKDEIVYQAMVVDDDGTGLYSTGLRHGDVMYVSDIYPDRPGLEVFTIQENEDDAELFQTPGAVMRDALTGEFLWSHSPAIDVTDGMVADIDPRHLGFEAWGGPGGLRNQAGQTIGKAPKLQDWTLWWDGDLLRELLSPGRDWNRRRRRFNQQRARNISLQSKQNVPEKTGPREDRDERDTQARPQNMTEEQRQRWLEFQKRKGLSPTRVYKWDYEQEKAESIAEIEGISMSRGPSLCGDIIGDWREELLLASPDGKSLRLYTTTIPTEHRLVTLLHDPQYRLGIAWQNVTYNTPCYPSFYLGDKMQSPPRPNIRLIGNGEAIYQEYPNSN